MADVGRGQLISYRVTSDDWKQDPHRFRPKTRHGPRSRFNSCSKAVKGSSAGGGLDKNTRTGSSRSKTNGAIARSEYRREGCIRSTSPPIREALVDDVLVSGVSVADVGKKTTRRHRRSWGRMAIGEASACVGTDGDHHGIGVQADV